MHGNGRKRGELLAGRKVKKAKSSKKAEANNNNRNGQK
jgi:hypothetical protein